MIDSSSLIPKVPDMRITCFGGDVDFVYSDSGSGSGAGGCAGGEDPDPRRLPAPRRRRDRLRTGRSVAFEVSPLKSVENRVVTKPRRGELGDVVGEIGVADPRELGPG